MAGSGLSVKEPGWPIVVVSQPSARRPLCQRPPIDPKILLTRVTHGLHITCRLQE